jgi:hypothetical protein
MRRTRRRRDKGQMAKSKLSGRSLRQQEAGKAVMDLYVGVTIGNLAGLVHQ